MAATKIAPRKITQGTISFGALAASGEKPAENKRWTCPMHPHYISSEFGPCPICGMDLVALQSDDSSAAAEGEARAIITIAPEFIQNMGVRLAPVEMTTFGRTIRSFGHVRENDRLQIDVTARVEGWIEGLSVTAVGDEVSADTKLFKLYSPQLIVSQNDFHLAKGSRQLKEQALDHLRSFGIQPTTLRQIENAAKPLQQVPFYAEQNGTVAELHVREGTYVKRGMLIAKIQDYSSVWLMVSVAEMDLPLLLKDTIAEVSFPNLPGHSVSAKVDYIYPTIDTKTRTGRVRLVIDNSDGQIRPGTYADVQFNVASDRRIAVPSEAILPSGDGPFIVVSLGQGRFEPRAVEVGLVTNNWSELKTGVEVGEQVVVSGQFLIDSESALRESFRKLERLQLPLSLLKLSKSEMAMVDHMIDAALYMHEAIVDGYDIDPKFLEPAVQIRDLLAPKFKSTQLGFVLDDGAAAIEEARAAKTESQLFAALSKLTKVLKPWIFNGAPEHYSKLEVAVFQETESDRAWLQIGADAVNPYGSGAAAAIPYPKQMGPQANNNAS